jgi:hypothetical protein
LEVMLCYRLESVAAPDARLPVIAVHIRRQWPNPEREIGAISSGVGAEESRYGCQAEKKHKARAIGTW